LEPPIEIKYIFFNFISNKKPDLQIFSLGFAWLGYCDAGRPYGGIFIHNGVFKGRALSLIVIVEDAIDILFVIPEGSNRESEKGRMPDKDIRA
jgi:hypothetical protein